MDVQWFADDVDTAFTAFLKQTPDSLKRYSDAIASLNPDTATGETIPAGLLEHFDQYEAEQHALQWAVGQVKQYIALRLPEIKDEDNAGVRVQETVIGFINKVRNGKPPKDDETGSDGSGASKLEYLSSRGKVEKAIADNKEIATYQLQLKELDRQQYLRLKLAWQTLSYQRSTLYGLLKLNREKIDQPRRKEYGMAL